MDALGLEVEGDLADEDLVVSVAGVAEVLQADGTMALMTFSSDPMTSWQQLGMFRAGALAMELDLKDAWREAEDD
jgi:hypothetical protein